ncbi:MAG: class I SAM-dependent methyltransferase [Candidatus Hydrogenedentes bacterium]|nr:class I SAM-dependent methyltransferase [Candidatus Hydrogenedentota bacterium]
MGVDYDQIAPNYDRHRHGGGPYLDSLVEAATGVGARRVLELGAGTGANTAAFLDAYPCWLIGLEHSRGMLEQAKGKQISAKWLHASGTNIPLLNASVDFIFACYVIHHIHDLAGLMRECARVIENGAAAFVTCPHDFIERHPANQYFPSFARIDKSRFQPLSEIADAMRAAGFQDIREKAVTAAPVHIDHAYVERVASQFISTYALLPQDEFQSGLAKMREDVEAKGRLDIDMVWECAIVWGTFTSRQA